MVGVSGVRDGIAASNRFRHWRLMPAGLRGKIRGPTGFIGAVASGPYPLAMGWIIVTIALIGWWAYGLILRVALL